MIVCDCVLYTVFFSLSGVGFSFISSWVLMAVVTTLFVVGGNTEKMLCEPLANRQLFKVLSSDSYHSVYLFPSSSVYFGQGFYLSGVCHVT